MRKIIISLALVFVLVSNAFAYTWQVEGGNWYVVDDTLGQRLTSTLVDSGSGVYYLDETGKMVTGWWRHPETSKVYFFDNDVDRNYGNMVFGLHIVDGYFRYFGDDGALATADTTASYKKVFEEYWADSRGMLYLNNELMRDTSINKSEFYSDPTYYKNPMVNNYFLSTQGTVYQPIGRIGKNGKEDNSPEVTDLERDKESTGSKKSAASRTAGGADYSVDASGHVTVADKSAKITDLEKYGPKANQ